MGSSTHLAISSSGRNLAVVPNLHKRRVSAKAVAGDDLNFLELIGQLVSGEGGDLNPKSGHRQLLVCGVLNLVQVTQNLYPQGLTLFFDGFELGAQLALLLHALAEQIDLGRNGLPALRELILHGLSQLIKELRDQGVIPSVGPLCRGACVAWNWV